MTKSAQLPRPFLVSALCASIGLFSYLYSAAAPATPANLGDMKRQITEYKRSGAYDRDVAAAIKKAEEYIDQRASAVRMPAIVLDVDETSLSNWPEIQANDYGTITGGPCNLPAGPCG